MTFSNMQPETDVTKRVGYFSASFVSPYEAGRDGIYLESKDGEIAFVISKANNQDSGGALIPNAPALGVGIDGTRDVAVAGVHSYGNEQYLGSITWRGFV